MTAVARLGAPLLALAALAASAEPRTAHAQGTNRPVLYRVRPGDTLALIAAEFYGDRTKAVFLMDENRMTRVRPLRPGERLRVPISRDIVTAPSDTFESLAGTYLGSARRSAFLAEWNGLSQDETLPAGIELTIPFTVVHVAQGTESIADIARTYFGDGKSAEVVRRYNFLDKTSIGKGEQLLVPAYHVRCSPAKQPGLDEKSRARRDRRREAMARAARALPAAQQAWRAGDFAGVKAALARSESELDYLDTDVAVDVAVLLGACHVAYDEDKLALACFQRAVARERQHVLRRYDYSPKLLAIWQKAGGMIE